MEENYLWKSGMALYEMRLLIEGARVLYEDEASVLLRLAIQNEHHKAADAFEAIVAAIYLDAKENGKDGYTKIIIDLFQKKIIEIQNGKPSDYKTLLQQFAEQDGTAVLRYETVQTGEMHDPTFITTAYINNNAVGTGTSGTKKGSEMAAARVALSLFGIIE